MTASGLVRLDAPALATLVDDEDPSHRAVALRHAAIHGRPVLWGDHPRRPTFAARLREARPRREVIAAGDPDAAVARLAAWSGGLPIALAAPPSWGVALPGQIARATIRTWRLAADARPVASSARVRRLGLADASAFRAGAEGWAARSWGDLATLMGWGAAYGVPLGPGFAALAWVFESDARFAKLAAATRPRYRRLGLGRAAAVALIGEVVASGRVPLWTAAAENRASAALARSLGFASPVDEDLLLWTPDLP